MKRVIEVRTPKGEVTISLRAEINTANLTAHEASTMVDDLAETLQGAVAGARFVNLPRWRVAVKA